MTNDMRFTMSVSFFAGEAEVQSFTLQPRTLQAMDDDDPVASMQFVVVLLNLLAGALSVEPDVRTVCKLNLLLQVVNL